jgi:hypothetical protein
MMALLRGVAAALAIIAFVVGPLGEGARSAPSGCVRVPPPGVRTSPLWVTLTTGATNPATMTPQLWGITTRGNVSALRPFDLFNGLRGLSRDAILIWSSTAGQGVPTRVFTRARWPLQISSSFRIDHSWEGQPAPRIQQRLRWAWVRGWRLDVRVYFGTQRPNKRLLTSAQAELNRLLLPGSR